MIAYRSKYEKNMPMSIGMFFLVVSAAALIFSSCSSSRDEALVIAVSANMQYTMKELVASYEELKGANCEVIVGSSGKLTAQIAEGAPFDLFFSADMKYPERIFDLGLSSGPPEIYAFGDLVLWTLKEGIDPVPESLADEKVTHIAIANPETAPFGEAAMEFLKNAEFEEEVFRKLVYGESIAQTNQFILSEAAELGITSGSVVRSSIAPGKGRWSALDSNLYDPIAQGFVVLKSEPEREKRAKDFVKFLKSSTGREILSKFGYKTKGSVMESS